MEMKYPIYYVTGYVWRKAEETKVLDGKYIPETLFESHDLEEAKKFYETAHPNISVNHIALEMETEEGWIRFKYKDMMDNGSIEEEIENDI